MKKLLLLVCTALAFTSCISTKSTLKNIDDSVPTPALSKEKTFILSEISADKKYGFNEDYPVNLGFLPIQTAEINVKRYFGALAGPKGEVITYEKVDTCCPFPSKKNAMGAGIIDIYEIKWNGIAKPMRLYINLYEKGKVMAPAGFTIRQIP